MHAMRWPCSGVPRVAFVHECWTQAMTSQQPRPWSCCLPTQGIQHASVVTAANIRVPCMGLADCACMPAQERHWFGMLT